MTTNGTLGRRRPSAVAWRESSSFWAVATLATLVAILAAGFTLGRLLDEPDAVELPVRPASASAAVIVPAVGVNERSGGLTVSLDAPGKANLGQPAPDFTVQTLDGGTARLSDFRGRPVLINFWATWCAPCLVEMPALEATYRKFQQQGLVVLAVNQAESAEAVKAYMGRHRLSFPAVLDPDTSVARLYRVTGYPTTWLVDRSGNLRELRRGAFSNAEQVERLVVDALAAN